MGIDYAKDGAIARFTLANGKVNPITPAMHRELHAAMLDFLADPELRVGILTGAGERAFSAGDDIRSESQGSGDPVTDLLGAMGPGPVPALGPGAAPDPPGYDAADALLRMERTKPVIGAARGWCLGRGLFYFLRLSDIRIATPDARFGLPEIAYGMGGIAGTMRLTRHLPPTSAWEMALTGEPIDAQEALRIHLVNRLVEPEELLPEARRIALSIARHPLLAVRTEMEALRRGDEMDADDAYAFGMTLYRQQRLAIAEPDVQETFLYKR
jgi:enoyl-CoA hydratase/carnithine racemase